MNAIVDGMHEIVPRSPLVNQRPFVCHGRPTNCTVMVIGENPGTALGIDWWSFWNDESGFDHGRFLLHYLAVKGITHIQRGARLRFDRLRDQHGLHCVETNVFADEGQSGAGEKPVSNAAVLKLFAQRLPRLNAIVVHGKKARWFMPELEPLLPPGVHCLPPVRHFSRISNSEFGQLVRRIKALPPRSAAA